MRSELRFKRSVMLEWLLAIVRLPDSAQLLAPQDIEERAIYRIRSAVHTKDLEYIASYSPRSGYHILHRGSKLLWHAAETWEENITEERRDFRE